VKETPKASNKGKYIDNWNKAFGLSKVPWCATFQSDLNKDGLVIYPKIHSAMAKSFAKGKTHSISEIMFDKYVPKAGDYRVKTRRGGNHVDVVISWNKETKKGLLLGGNVGDKVSIREFTVKSMIADGTTHITEVKGNYDYYLDDNDFKEWLKQFGTVRQKVVVYKQRKFIDTLIIPATWYDLHGYRTASGVRFDRTKLTAAHKSLPLGTKAVIEYKGRRVQIEINDRCPKRGIIDLSPAVCDSLKFRSGKVKVLIIGK
jgi:hypothetical protein